MASSLTPLILDGSVLEGGGQLLRNAIAYSTLLCKPVTIENVRAGRTPPGLKRQHAAGIKLAASLCSAEVTGCFESSKTVSYVPGPLARAGGTYEADPGTAGSTTLMLQVSLPCLLFSPPYISASSAIPGQTELPTFSGSLDAALTSDPDSSPTANGGGKAEHLSTLLLRGGTNATLAPQIDYTQHIFLPFLRRHFLPPSAANSLELKIERRGYHPRGGGSVRVMVPSLTEPLRPIRILDRPSIAQIHGEARVGGLPAVVAREMRDGANSVLSAAKEGIPGVSQETKVLLSSVREQDNERVGAGGGTVLWATSKESEGGESWTVFGGSAVSSRKVKPVEVGRSAAEELVKALKEGNGRACVDEYLQDQIIIFMALAEGESVIRTGPLSLHAETAIWVAKQMTDAKFKVEEDNGAVIITCQGIGYNPSLMPATSVP